MTYKNFIVWFVEKYTYVRHEKALKKELKGKRFFVLLFIKTYDVKNTMFKWKNLNSL